VQARRNDQELRDAHFAMRLSLIVGLAMLIGKTTVYFMTASSDRVAIMES
jgi:hypothetical protein